MCCWICQEKRNPGTSVHGTMICDTCQQRIVGLVVDDPEYDHILAQVKVMWMNWLTEGPGEESLN